MRRRNARSLWRYTIRPFAHLDALRDAPRRFAHPHRTCLFGALNRAHVPPATDDTYSCFDASRASLAPWVVRQVKTLCRDMALAIEEIREIFIGVSIRLPIPKDSFKLWAVLQVALEGALESDDAERCSRVIQKPLD